MKYRVKKRWPAAGLAIIAALGFAIFVGCFLDTDHSGYKKILARVNPALHLEMDQTYRATQQREGVKKDFWQVKGDQRLEALLICENADLFYEKEGNRQVIVENMDNVRCMMQEELYYVDSQGRKVAEIPSGMDGYVERQAIRCFDAKTAKYHYSSETLDAYQVKMELYEIPGHDLPRSLEGYKPAMEGRADHVNLAIIDKDLDFKADRFKGSVFPRSEGERK